MTSCRSPKSSEDFDKYYQLRWQVLRKPWGKPPGSEQDDLEQQSFHRMIVDENQQVLAVGRLERTSQFQGQIRYMAVSENSQGHGLGKQIISALEQQAKQLGLKSIELKARENAVGFYENIGYQQQGFSHLLFDEIKHFTMTKSLAVGELHQKELTHTLQSTWHETIPLSKAMNIEISYYDRAKLMTHCDPEFNKNLHNTMFAGSIYTLATLTGWGWVYLQLEQAKLLGDIVLADANIRYHAPVEGVAHGQVDFDDVAGSLAPLNEGKKAKVGLTARLYCGEQVVATFTGTYFVIPKSK